MGCVTLLTRPWFVLLLFGSLVLLTRVPHLPGQLFTFDDVNLAYSIHHFDVRVSQPQPPGYPLFVLQMRVLYWLRFRHVEKLLGVLALAGSIAALFLLSQFGRRLLGGLSGFFAACLLVFHPVFWHSGITSALRVQLAVISVLVAWSCWRAFAGERKWALWSAVVLGLSAGIRPEIGPLLFPLWAVSAWRAGISRRDWFRALAAMAGAVALWLLPAMLASGGPISYIKANLDYITDQASVSSSLFGAVPDRWQTTLWRLLVWTCCGLLAWPLPAVLAWKRGEGWGLAWQKQAFLALWLLPPLAFAIFVHLEDPGQTLAMAPPIALFGGYLFNRAFDHWNARVSRWQTVTLVVASLAVAWHYEFRDAQTLVVWLPVIALATALLLKIAQVPNAGYLPSVAVLAFLLSPLVIFQFALFYTPWYYKGPPATYEQALADINTGLALTSLNHIDRTLEVDDHSLREAIRLTAERPGKSVIIWEQGLVTWRKAAYYLPNIPIVVLDHKKLRSGTPPVIVIWKGPIIERRIQAPSPLTVPLPSAARIIWLLNPNTDFYALAASAFPLTQSGPIYYTDLPPASTSKPLGEYTLQW